MDPTIIPVTGCGLILCATVWALFNKGKQINQSKPMIKLGQKVKCVITGFEGIAIAKLEFINGCVQYCVKPPIKEGKMMEGEYIDQQQLAFVDEGINIDAKPTGGVMSDMPKAR